MGKMSVVVPHSLQGKEIVHRFNGQLQAKLNQAFSVDITDLFIEWQDFFGNFSLKAGGRDITGSLKVETNRVEITVDLPWGAGLLININQTRADLKKHVGELLSA